MLVVAALPASRQSAPNRQQQLESHPHQAQEYLKENKLDLAASEFGAIIALDPKNVNARGTLVAAVQFLLSMIMREVAVILPRSRV